MNVQVLWYDAGNVEAIACLGSYHFYSDQPEIAMNYYRRILQMGKQIQVQVGSVLCLDFRGRFVETPLACLQADQTHVPTA